MTAFRTIDGKPIFWRAPSRLLHRCEGDRPFRDVLLIWTYCGIDVPAASQAFAADAGTVTVDCPACRARTAPAGDRAGEDGA